MNKSEFVTLRLDEALLSRVDSRAESEDRSRAAIVRMALDSYLPQVKASKKASKRPAKRAPKKVSKKGKRS